MSNNTEVVLNLNAFYRKKFYSLLDSLITLFEANIMKSIEKILPLYELFRTPLQKENITIERLNVVNLLDLNRRICPKD